MRTAIFTLLVLLASTGLAQPAVPPTALVEGLGLRLYDSDDPEPILGLTGAGERLWVATGSTDSQTKSRALYVEPNPERDDITAFYLRDDGTAAPLPEPGVAPERPMIFNHEGTTIAAIPDLTIFLTNDGLGAPGYSYVLDTRDGLAFEVIRREGERWGNGAKNMDAAITASGGLAVLHSAAEPGHWPNLLASTDRARDFAAPDTRGRSGEQVLIVRLLPVRRADGREIVYAFWVRIGAKRHPLWGTVEVVGGRPVVTVLAESYEQLFPAEALEPLPRGGVAGPQPRWLGAWSATDGVLMDTANRGLWYWHEDAGRARLVENVYGDHTSDPRYFDAAGAVYRLSVEGELDRLDALDPETVRPTWTRLATLAFPDDAWTARGAPAVRGTPEGALWVYGPTPQTYPPTGQTVRDIALAYWAPGTALPASD